MVIGYRRLVLPLLAGMGGLVVALPVVAVCLVLIEKLAGVDLGRGQPNGGFSVLSLSVLILEYGLGPFCFVLFGTMVATPATRNAVAAGLTRFWYALAFGYVFIAGFGGREWLPLQGHVVVGVPLTVAAPLLAWRIAAGLPPTSWRGWRAEMAEVVRPRSVSTKQVIVIGLYLCAVFLISLYTRAGRHPVP